LSARKRGPLSGAKNESSVGAPFESSSTGFLFVGGVVGI
jgi:hypothetical protein